MTEVSPSALNREEIETILDKLDGEIQHLGDYLNNFYQINHYPLHRAQTEEEIDHVLHDYKRSFQRVKMLQSACKKLTSQRETFLPF